MAATREKRFERPWAHNLLNFFLVLAYLALLNNGFSSNIIYSTTTAPEIIEAYSIHYGVRAQPLIDTLWCESHFEPDAIHYNDGHGNSYGIAQINTYYNPSISRREALNPIFSIDFAARMFSQGKATMWSCYRAVNDS